MNRVFAKFTNEFAFLSCLLLLCFSSAVAQVAVTPAKVTMLVGDSQPFRAVDSRGQMLTNVHWTISREGIADLAQGPEVQVVAKQLGGFTLTAHAGEGSAEAHVEVRQGPTLPMGTIRWSGVDWPGCKTAKIMPAVPSATGVADVFEDAECADGHYVAAYTADGIMAWRRKVTAKSGGQPSPEEVAAAAPMNLHGASVCDSISVYMKRADVQALLSARKLNASSVGEDTLFVEEESTECRVWFDTQSQVVKKRKTILGD
jgi:hypothetical protein